MPTVQKVHIDKVLTNISIGYQNEAYIGDQIFLPLPVEKQSDRYFVYGKEMFRTHNDLRAPGTEANEINWTLGLDQYYCEGHALRHPIADEERQNADDNFTLESDATSLISEGILLNKEVDAATKVLDPNNYATDHKVTMGAGGGAPAKWSDYTNSDPVLDIAKAKQVVHKKTGVRANTLIISEPVLNVLLRHTKLISMLSNNNVQLLNLDLLRQLLQVDRILVGSALKSSATNPGQADNLDYIWGNSAVLSYIPKAPGKKQIALGYSFMWNKDGAGAVQVRQWYEMARRATIIEAERWYSQKIVSNVAGYLFADAVTPLSF